MVPQVAATAGPLVGERFSIESLPFSIGRAASNRLAIQDVSLSRQHCVILQSDRGFLLRDLQSRNGTYVNGLPIGERELRHGEEIQIGHSVLVFLTEAGRTADIGPTEAQEDAPSPGERDMAVTRELTRQRLPSPYSDRQIAWLESENRRLQAESGLSQQMVGNSPRIRQVHDFIVKVAPTTSTVLIRGESGTGKEIVARALHRNSGRAAKPFVAINSAALTESLLESELFGYEKGAFTGGVRRQGKLEAANGGTLFLDELGELPLAFQVKLLRVLQEREFERVGGTQPVKVDVRLVAATHKNLEEAVKNGSFRADLYYRLNVVAVTVPPLRERRDDILPLARHFAARHAEKCGRPLLDISEEAAAYLTGHDWPGNVRELENAIERVVGPGRRR